MNGVVDSYFKSRPGRKRAVEELSRLDEEEELLAGRVDRMVRQRCVGSIRQAVFRGDVEEVLEGLANGADVNESDEGRDSLLHIAVVSEDLRMVRALLAGGAEAERGTALDFASTTGNNEILLALLDAGANANEIGQLRHEEILLMQATQMGLARAVDALLQLGVDSGEVEQGLGEDGHETGVFPLLVASRTGFPDVVRALVGGGAAADQATTLIDRSGNERKGVTALLVASEVASTP